MKTILLPDNFPQPKFQIGQTVMARCEHLMTPMPVTGIAVGLFYVFPETAGDVYRAPGWHYAVSFVDLGLPSGIADLLVEPSGFAHEADVQAV